jgi:hypothetical protein
MELSFPELPEGVVERVKNGLGDVRRDLFAYMEKPRRSLCERFLVGRP